MSLCMCPSRQFDETYQNSFWRKVVQMQPLWLCVCSGSQFEETFTKKTHMNKIHMWIIILSDSLSRHVITHSGCVKAIWKKKLLNMTNEEYVKCLSRAIIPSLSDPSLTDWTLFSRLDWCDPGTWRSLCKTCWGCDCCWFWCLGTCCPQFVADLEGEVLVIGLNF